MPASSGCLKKLVWDLCVSILSGEKQHMRTGDGFHEDARVQLTYLFRWKGSVAYSVQLRLSAASLVMPQPSMPYTLDRTCSLEDSKGLRSVVSNLAN